MVDWVGIVCVDCIFAVNYYCIGKKHTETNMSCLVLQKNKHLYKLHITLHHQERPYHADRTTSRPLCEVKRRRARLVLRWGTTWEALVLFLFALLRFLPPSFFYTRFCSALLPRLAFA